MVYRAVDNTVGLRSRINSQYASRAVNNHKKVDQLGVVLPILKLSNQY